MGTYDATVSPEALVPLFVLIAVLSIDSWVYVDATRREEQGRPVVFHAGSMVVGSPIMWLIGCLLLWVVFFPLYLASRA